MWGLMHKLHSQVTQILTSTNQAPVLDVIYTGSQLSGKHSPPSDYDFIIVMRDSQSVLEMKEFRQKLAQYSKFPLDLIVTSLEGLLKTNPLLSYSALFNNIRIPGYAVTKLTLPAFDPFLLKTSTLKILAKNLAANSFKSHRHIKKAFSFFQMAQSKENEVINHLINSDYEKDYLGLSFGKMLQENDFELTPQLKEIIISALNYELEVIRFQEDWEKYEMLSSGIDPALKMNIKEAASIKETYVKSVSRLLDLAKGP